MKVLVIGGGGREHAVCRALSRSKSVTRLLCAPGNGGIASVAECVPIAATDVAGIVDYAKNNAVDFVVVTPDGPLALGMVDALEEAGIACVHDKGIYDYPSYQGAYNRSYEAISKHLKEYPTIRVVLDVHRDALEDSDGTVYKTIAQVGDVTCAQVMMVVGTNDSGLNHPNWERNLRFALALQQKMQELYPTLAKPIELSRFRYNQQATPGSLIVEIGCTGNTLEEALQAARYFADAAAKVLGELKEAS